MIIYVCVSKQLSWVYHMFILLYFGQMEYDLEK